MARLLATVVTCLVCSKSIAANIENDPLLTESEFFGEVPVVYSAARLAQPKHEAPSAVTIIDAEMIEASGVRRIEDIFKLVPGFQVGYYKGYYGNVTYHGMGEEFVRRMQVFVDGRSVYGPLFGGVAWYDLPLAIEDIERIEVIRGANAATYGSNAFFGVINIVTRHSSQQTGNYAKLTFGSDNARDAVYRHAWIDDEDSYRITARYRQDDGFDLIPDKERTGILTFRSDIRLDANDTLDIQMGLNAGTRENGFYGDQIIPARETDTYSHFQHILWRHVISNEEEIKVNFFHNYRNHDDDFATEPLNLGGLGIVQIPLSFDVLEQRFDLEFQHTIQLNPDWRVNWGASTRLERVRGELWFNRKDTLESTINRLSVNSEWHINSDNILNFGAMIEDADEFGTHLMPRLSYNYHINSDNTIRAGVSRAKRKPVPFEEYGHQVGYVGNTAFDINILALGGLKPEQITTYEVAYLQQNLSKGLQWNTRLYRDEIRDIITEIKIPVTEIVSEQEAFSYANTGSVDITGLEFELEYRPDEKLRFIFNQAFMRVESFDYDHTTYDIVLDETHVNPSVPDYTTSLMFIYQLEKQWQVSSTVYRVGEMEWLSEGGVNKGYNRIDIRIAKKLKLNDLTGNIAFVIQNLGRKYEDFSGTNDHPDNIFDTHYLITLDLNF